MTETCEQSSC